MGKCLIFIQRFLATLVGIYGCLAMFSEVPEGESVWDQLCVTLGGVAIIGVCVLWLWLTGIEEDRFIHEAR